MATAGDPYSAAFGAAASVAGAALKDGTQAQTTSNSSGFDNSGWNINIGSGSVSNSQSKGALGGIGQLLQNPMVLLAIGVGLLLVIKAKK